MFRSNSWGDMRRLISVSHVYGRFSRAYLQIHVPSQTFRKQQETNPIGIPGGSRKELGSEDFTYPNELIKILFSSACTHDSHHLERILVENSKTRHHFMRLVKSIEINIVKEQNLTNRMAYVRFNKIHTFYKKTIGCKICITCRK